MNEVNTKVAEPRSRPVADDERPDTSHLDWSKAIIGRRARKPGETTEVFIDGAVAYRLRLIPSNKVLSSFATTLEAWPVIIATIEGGRSPRTLAFDAIFADGATAKVSSGPRLEMWARHNNGAPNPDGDLWTAAPRRVAEGTA